MFVVCDNTRCLSEGYFFRGSYLESVISFRSRFPNVRSVNVYRDVRSRGRCEDFQFIATLNSKQLDKLYTSFVNPDQTQ